MEEANKPIEASAEEAKKLNFLEEIIESDLAEGKYKSILTIPAI